MWPIIFFLHLGPEVAPLADTLSYKILNVCSPWWPHSWRRREAWRRCRRSSNWATWASPGLPGGTCHWTWSVVYKVYIMVYMFSTWTCKIAFPWAHLKQYHSFCVPWFLISLRRHNTCNDWLESSLPQCSVLGYKLCLFSSLSHSSSECLNFHDLNITINY